MCRFVPLPSESGYIEKTNQLYDILRSEQSALTSLYEAGSAPDALESKTWDQFCSCLCRPES